MPCLRSQNMSTMPDSRGPGPIQREHRDKVLEVVGLQPREQLAHPLGFQLEHAEGVARHQQLVGGRVARRQVFQVRRRATHALDVV